MNIGIITLYGNKNYGNKLQNYALQKYLEKFENIDNIYTFIPMNGIINSLKSMGRRCFIDKREKNFIKFNKNILYYKKRINVMKPNIPNNFDFLIFGSDQVWNVDFEGKLPLYAGLFENSAKKISYSASFGNSFLPKNMESMYKQSLEGFYKISVREDFGKKIVHDLTERQDSIVLVDPTMLLESNEWDKVAKKPKQIESLCPDGEKYILNYFLGNLSNERKNEIDRVAKANNCKIINILMKDDPFYSCGPDEFVWLEKNAFMICTDSFHSSVFAILYKRPFIVFNRDDGQKGKNSMNSRLETLLNKFQLENRYFNGKIEDNLLECDYSHVDIILKAERKKSNDFLKNCFK